MARADELRAERQAVGPAHERHAQRRQAAERPQRAEHGVARGGETRRRDAGGGGREQRVVFLLEQLAEAFVQARNLCERLEILRRGVAAAPLDSPAQPLGEARAALVPFARETHRDFGLHDEAVPRPGLLDGRRQLDLLDAIAEALHELREGVLRVVVEAIPVRRLHEAERRWNRRLLRRDGAIRRGRAHARLELALVVRDARFQQQRDVIDRASEQTDRVEGLRDPRHPAPRDQTARRLEPVDAAVRCRSHRRSARLAAERQRHHPDRDGGRGAAGRPARRVRGIVRVPRLARRSAREFGGDRLAHDDGAGAAQQRDDGGVTRWRPAGVQRRAVLRRHVGRVDDVLDADRHTVEWSDRPARQTVLVRRTSLGQRVIRIEERPCLDARIRLAYPRQTRRDVLLGGDHAFADESRGVGGGQRVQVRQVHQPTLVRRSRQCRRRDPGTTRMTSATPSRTVIRARQRARWW